MLSSRISSLFCAITALLFLTLPVSASELQGIIHTFTSEIPSLPQGLGQELSSRLVHEPGGTSSSSVIDSGSVYSLVAISLQQGQEPELGLLAKNRALMKASMRLAFVVGQGGLDRQLFRYDDALGSALLTYYESEISGRGMKGIQTAADIIDGYALGLAWVDSRTAGTLSSAIPERGTLDDAYCRFLYRNHAEVLFRVGKYSEALPIFLNIHEFRWSDVDAYLDAAECFLRTGQPKECMKLLRELRAELDAKMTSRNLERAGKLFSESGDKKTAAETFIHARKRLHEEQRKGI